MQARMVRVRGVDIQIVEEEDTMLEVEVTLHLLSYSIMALHHKQVLLMDSRVLRLI